MTPRALGLSLITLAACSADPSSVDVSFRFDPAELLDDAVFVEIRTQTRDCAFVDLTLAPTLRLDRDGASTAHLDLDEPTYLPARARDRSCRWFARGCGHVSRPATTPRSIVIDLRRADALPMCDPSDCIEGTCVSGDLPEGIAPPAPDAGPPPPPLDDGRDH